MINPAALAWINLVATLLEQAPAILAALERDGDPATERELHAASDRLQTAADRWNVAVARRRAAQAEAASADRGREIDAAAAGGAVTA